jgi:predicted RNA-binding Zn-ribbon protein involved in translation (DUF1610 family)
MHRRLILRIAAVLSSLAMAVCILAASSLIHEYRIRPPDSATVIEFGSQSPITGAEHGIRLRNMMLSFAAAAVVFAILPIWSVMARVKYRDGHCRSCGYDIRASKDRCPECGTDLRTSGGGQEARRRRSPSPMDFPQSSVTGRGV